MLVPSEDSSMESERPANAHRIEGIDAVLGGGRFAASCNRRLQNGLPVSGCFSREAGLPES